MRKGDWEIHGCPVNGPDADGDGQNTVMAWYSGGGKNAGVNAIFLDSNGKPSGKNIPIDDFLQGSLGRVQVLLLNENEALVTWMKSKDNGHADLYGRRVHRDGRRGTPVIISEIGGSRGVGFPQMQKVDNKLVIAWTKAGDKEYDTSGIEMVSFNFTEIPAIEKKDAPQVSAPVAAIAKGEFIPDFSAKDIERNDVKLSTYRGKTILLNFWASWCDACIEEFSLFNELEKKYASKGLKIILMNVDEEEDWASALKLIAKTKLASTVWRDLDNKTQPIFGFSALPYTLIIDKSLAVRATMVGSLLPNRKDLEERLEKMLK